MRIIEGFITAFMKGHPYVKFQLNASGGRFSFHVIIWVMASFNTYIYGFELLADASRKWLFSTNVEKSKGSPSKRLEIYRQKLLRRHIWRNIPLDAKRQAKSCVITKIKESRQC